MGLARSAQELEAIQRLRFDIFTEEMDARFPSAAQGLDADGFDPWCEHFLVKDLGSDSVVGTYRLLMPDNVVKAGGYYTESEFDLSGLACLRPSLVEVGRSCIHPDFRQGAVIMLLWSGIAGFMRKHGLRYALGCASVSLRDGGAAAAQVWRHISGGMKSEADFTRVTPHHPYPVTRAGQALPARMPPLIKGYLKLGADICGMPAWDPDFNTADFPVLLDIERMDSRYRRHFGMD